MSTETRHAVTLGLEEAARDEAVVQITKADGRTFVGVPVLVEHLTYKIATGKRGRPAIVHVDDVEEVSAP